jgi:predicted ester cyclase
MTANSTSVSTDPAAVYRTFMAALNAKDLDAAATVVDTTRYRENCVGFTRGFVGWPAATASLRQVWKGLPDLHVEITDLQAGEASALAHGTVCGTNTGKLYGAPATKKSYEATFFDWVRLENGLIVERVQQADLLGQMRQLYGKAFGPVALAAMLWRL